MMIGARNVLRCGRSIGRGQYLAFGAALFAVKFATDWTISRLAFQRTWSPAEYIAPGSSLALLFTAAEGRAFYLTMLLIALPFVFLGVSLTAMRLRSIGLSAGWTALFFVPGINFAFFALLIGLPGRREIPLAALAPEALPPSPQVGVAPLLNYGLDARREPWFDAILPVNRNGARALAIFLPVPIALLATYVSIQCFSTYGWGVFVGVPFAIGLMSSALYAARSPRGLRGLPGCIGVACLSLAVYGLSLLLIAFEGAVCIIMAAPLAYPLAILGAVVGASLAGARTTAVRNARWVVAIMLVFLPVFTGAERLAAPPAPVYSVVTSVDIDAPPARVWSNVINFRQIPPPTDWLFHTGVAYPLRADIVGAGPGAMRYCVFSTGPFVEPIRVWDEPRLLKFDVTSNPPPMNEWSPWTNIHPPHLHNFLVSHGGQFRLTVLPGGRTRLEGTTWYQHHMWPAGYWRLWSDFIIHRIHARVLNHVKAISERRE